ncbi:MAG TPA: ABC transporter permease subunit [Sedimentisphaerales bacterium]|nr:ABC transporter permease subunit [Sedimentisphaerales bacterium]
MIYKLLVIAKNTFTETLRQPVYAVILVAAMLMFIISPALSLYTIGEDDNRLLRELGLSTLFLSGLFIAVFAAAAAVSREIEEKTVATVLTKPVPRPLFIIGKFIGLVGAVGLAQYLGTMVMMMTVRHGVVASATHRMDYPVLVIGIIAGVGTLLLSAFLNYFYDWKFSATGVVIATILLTLGMSFLYFIDPLWKFDPGNNGFESFEVYAALLLFMGTLTILSVAVALSTRFNIVVTLTCCAGVFLLGLISDYIYAQLVDTKPWAIIGRAILPSLQIFWVSDAITEGTTVTAAYVASVGIYTAFFIIAMLLLAISLFQKRQIG